MATLESILEEFERELDRIVMVDMTHPQDGTLWHYTDAAGMEGILRSSQVFLTDFRHLNDPTELTYGEDLIVQLADELLQQATPKGLVRPVLQEFLHVYRGEGGRFTERAEVFVGSFCCDDGDRLSQWRAYGDHGRGYAIGFRSLPRFMANSGTADFAGALYRLEYRPEEFKRAAGEVLMRTAQRIDELMHQHLPTFNQHQEWVDRVWRMSRDYLLMAVATLCQRTKDPGFDEESEWRLLLSPFGKRDAVEYRSTRRGLIPFVKFDLSNAAGLLDLEGVRVGPSPNAENSRRALEGFLKSLKYPEPEKLALKSRIPYRHA